MAFFEQSAYIRYEVVFVLGVEVLDICGCLSLWSEQRYNFKRLVTWPKMSVAPVIAVVCLLCGCRSEVPSDQGNELCLVFSKCIFLVSKGGCYQVEARKIGRCM